jgi:hypothetical protein
MRGQEADGARERSDRAFCESARGANRLFLSLAAPPSCSVHFAFRHNAWIPIDELGRYVRASRSACQAFIRCVTILTQHNPVSDVSERTIMVVKHRESHICAKEVFLFVTD